MSVWAPDNIHDVAESVGIGSLTKDAAENLARDVEYRLAQVIEEALKFMRHAKRTTLGTQDISQALRVLGVEPLYGYESTRPLRFGEASLGPGQPLYYVEDEEVDFEKLINAPLPKVPREVSFTSHWLAIEGVQPSIPQNPTSSDARHQDLLPKGPGANPMLSAINGNDNVSVKPLVKHVLSKELQLYFERITSAVLDEHNEDFRIAAFASLRTDPGLHQLVPYFVQYVAEKVTHNVKNLFVLTQMMHLTSALLDNPSLFMSPYVASIIPPVLTCLVGAKLGRGSESEQRDQYALRDIAGRLLISITRKYGSSSQMLKPRIARTCLKHFLDPKKPFGAHYGAITGLAGIAGSEGIRVLVLPNLKTYDAILKEGLADESTRPDAEMVLGGVMGALEILERETFFDGIMQDEQTEARLIDEVGEVVGRRIIDSNRPKLVKAVLQSRTEL